MTRRGIRLLVTVSAVAVAASALVAGNAGARASASASTTLASQISGYCVSFYAGDNYFTDHKANCGKIGACYASHLKGVTYAQFQAVAKHNALGKGPTPPKASNVHSAEKSCEKALPGLSAFVDGTAGDT